MQMLTDNQKRFAEEYVFNGYNATQAYLKAYNTDNYGTANSEAYRLLRKPHVKEYVDKLLKESYEATLITAERVALKLAEIAFSEKEDKEYNASAKLKALDLLQKQLNLQHQKIDANICGDVEINIID